MATVSKSKRNYMYVWGGGGGSPLAAASISAFHSHQEPNCRMAWQFWVEGLASPTGHAI